MKLKKHTPVCGHLCTGQHSESLLCSCWYTSYWCVLYRQVLWLLQRTEWLMAGVFLPLEQISRLDFVLC